MIKLKNTDVYGFEAAIRGMRNPWNSWEKSDSLYSDAHNCEECAHKEDFSVCHSSTIYNCFDFIIGENDFALMKKLVSAGTDHSKFMRMVNVTCDITAPLYWWKEFDTYKVGTVRNSCSTMHTITNKEFELDDFSHEHIYNDVSTEPSSLKVLLLIIDTLNQYRHLYLVSKCKGDWRQIIQLLPSSYNQRATVQLNYAVLRNMYHSRKNHPLDEWRDFCRWIESLPYSELITGGNGDEMQP